MRTLLSILCTSCVLLMPSCSAEAPDCNGGAQAYGDLCGADEATMELKYNACASYEINDDAAQAENARGWVECVESAASCEEADGCGTP